MQHARVRGCHRWSRTGLPRCTEMEYDHRPVDQNCVLALTVVGERVEAGEDDSGLREI